MKPSNLLHLFALILLISFTISEQNNIKANFKEKEYNLIAEKTHVTRFAGKTTLGQERIIQLNKEIKYLNEDYKYLQGLEKYKYLVILFFACFVIWLFVAYFYIDFDDEESYLEALNYKRQSWLLSFFLLVVVAFWSLYFRGSEVFAFIFYLIAIASLVRSLMVATELQLISKKRGSRSFVGVTIFTSVILYFNFIILAICYYTIIFDNNNTLTALLDLIK